MEFDHSKLKGRIVEKYGSVAEMCRQLGYEPTKMSVKLNHTGFTRADIVKISDHLGISQEEIGLYFFTPKVKISEQEDL